MQVEVLLLLEVVQMEEVVVEWRAAHLRKKRGLIARHREYHGAEALGELVLDLWLVRVPHAVEERLPDLREIELLQHGSTLEVASQRLHSLVTRLLVCAGRRGRQHMGRSEWVRATPYHSTRAAVRTWAHPT